MIFQFVIGQFCDLSVVICYIAACYIAACQLRWTQNEAACASVSLRKATCGLLVLLSVGTPSGMENPDGLDSLRKLDLYGPPISGCGRAGRFDEKRQHRAAGTDHCYDRVPIPLQVRTAKARQVQLTPQTVHHFRGWFQLVDRTSTAAQLKQCENSMLQFERFVNSITN